MLIASRLSRTDAPVAAAAATGHEVLLAGDDDRAISELVARARAYDPAAYGGERLEIYAVFDSEAPLRLMQTAGVGADVLARADILATTIDDLCAKTVLVRLPGIDSDYPALDREPISRDSDSTVQLVIFGDSPQTDALAINAALVAHYPNYCRDSRLRTRITIVDDRAFAIRDRLVQRYPHLFANSYYRTIDLRAQDPAPILHRPENLARLGDFVDVEWEFVRGDSRSAAVCRKLSEWSGSPRRQLTVALCSADHAANVAEALSLPPDLYRRGVTVLCRTDGHAAIDLARSTGAYDSLRAFGVQSCSIETLRCLKALGRGINYVYSHSFALPADAPLAPPAVIDRETMRELWYGIGSLSKRYSNIFGAMTFGSKMHSLGHTDPATDTYYALSISEIDTLTEVEHNRWSTEELILGYRPVTASEQVAIEADIALKKRLRDSDKAHYDLRAFADLRPDATGKPVEIYDKVLTQAIPLIVKTCITD